MAKKSGPAPKDERTGKTNDKDSGHIADAHRQADEDISNDPEFSAHSPNDDLDEGETARLGEGENPLV